MNTPKRTRTRRIMTDILGFLLIVLSALTGWLPGPGGIPLLILGLSLLATNHEWAERILLHVKIHGLNFTKKLFDGSPRLKLVVDLTGIALIVLGVLVVTLVTQSVAKTAALSLFAASMALLLGNRNRLDRIKQYVKKTKKP